MPAARYAYAEWKKARVHIDYHVEVLEHYYSVPYALIKKVSLGYARKHFRMLVNKARTASDAQAVHDNIAEVAHSRQLARLDYAGYVPLDEHLRQASRLCQPVAGLFPDSPSALAYQTVASALLAWPSGDADVGGLEQFVQQLLHLSQRIDPTAIYA